MKSINPSAGELPESDFEQLIAGAKPTLDAVSLQRVLYQAGLTAGQTSRSPRLDADGPNRSGLFSHVVTATVAAALVWIVLSLPTQRPDGASHSPNSTTDVAKVVPLTSNHASPVDLSSRQILRPVSDPLRLIRTSDSPTSPTDDVPSAHADEAVLHSRSVLF